MNYIKGSSINLPVWLIDFIERCIQKKETKLIAISKGQDWNVTVSMAPYSACLVGEYCDMYSDLIDAYGALDLDFRVTVNSETTFEEYANEDIIIEPDLVTR